MFEFAGAILEGHNGVPKSLFGVQNSVDSGTLFLLILALCLCPFSGMAEVVFCPNF